MAGLSYFYLIYITCLSSSTLYFVLHKKIPGLKLQSQFTLVGVAAAAFAHAICSVK